jgi:hypothetical protein
MTHTPAGKNRRVSDEERGGVAKGKAAYVRDVIELGHKRLNVDVRRFVPLLDEISEFALRIDEAGVIGVALSEQMRQTRDVRLSALRLAVGWFIH